MKKFFLIASVGINFLCASFFIYKRLPEKFKYITAINDSTLYISKYKTYENRNEIFNYFHGSPDDIIYFGDSLTENFPLQEMFNNLNVKNRGVTGNTSSDLIGRVKSVIHYQPKEIFIMIGINDILCDIPDSVTYKNISNTISCIKTNSPNTTIYLQSILPISDSSKTSQIIRYNAWLKNYAKANSIQYIDIFSQMFNGVNIYPELTYDGLHLKIAGYKIWRKAIEGFIK